MNKRIFWARGAVLGAGLMALLDPERGKRRRALLRDKAARAADAIGDGAGTTARDLRNRIAGLLAEARHIVARKKTSDEVLVERVRSKLGRVVSHPASVEVTARTGRVILAGPVLESEKKDLISCVESVRGVRAVEDRLETHKQAGTVPGLQGGKGKPSARFELMQRNWSPTARLLAGTAGAGLALYGAKQRGFLRAGLAALGGGLLAHSATNMEFKRLLGLGAGRRGIDIRKSIFIDAPVDEVFAFWRNWENFPRFLSHVREVRDNGRGCTHWKVAGPAGVTVEWDAILTKEIPDHLLAWKSAPAQAIRHAGVVQFDEPPQGGTRLDIRMSYKPPAGALGHAVAALFGADPERALDEDMVRLKSLLEEGKTSAHGEPVTIEEVSEQTPPEALRSERRAVAPRARPGRKGAEPHA